MKHTRDADAAPLGRTHAGAPAGNGGSTNAESALARLVSGEDNLVLHTVLRFLNNRDLYAGPLRASRRLSHVAARALDPAANGGLAMLWAARHGRTGLVRSLLQLSPEPQQSDRVNVAQRGPQALLQATRRGHVDIVRLLAEDPRVDVAKYGMGAMAWAVLQNRTGIVRVLLDSERIDPTVRLSLPGAPDTNILLWAIEHGRVGAVRMILEDGRVDPAAGGSRAIAMLLPLRDARGRLRGARGGSDSSWAIIGLLIDDGRADPSVDGNALLIHAASAGATGIVRKLMRHARLDRRAGVRTAAWKASLGGHVDILRVMAHHLPGVKSMAEQFLGQAGISPATRAALGDIVAGRNLPPSRVAPNRHSETTTTTTTGAEKRRRTVGSGAYHGAQRHPLARLADGDDDYMLYSVLRFLDVEDLYEGPLRASRRLEDVVARAMNPAKDDGILLLLSVHRKQVDSVAWLLRDGRVDPGGSHGASLSEAVIVGSVDIVKMLLNDRRVASDPVALRRARVRAYQMVHQYLDTSGRYARRRYDVTRDRERLAYERIASILSESWISDVIGSVDDYNPPPTIARGNAAANETDG